MSSGDRADVYRELLAAHIMGHPELADRYGPATATPIVPIAHCGAIYGALGRPTTR